MPYFEPERPQREPDTNFITFDVGEDTDAYPMFSFWKPTKMDEERYAKVSNATIQDYLEHMFQRLLTLDGAYATE